MLKRNSKTFGSPIKIKVYKLEYFKEHDGKLKPGIYGRILKENENTEYITIDLNNPSYERIGKYKDKTQYIYKFENDKHDINIRKNDVNNYYWFHEENISGSPHKSSIRSKIGKIFGFSSSKRTKSKSKGGKRKNKRKTQRRSR